VKEARRGESVMKREPMTADFRAPRAETILLRGIAKMADH